MEVVQEPNIVSHRIKAILDDPQWLEHIKDPQLKQIKRRNFFEDIILDFCSY